MQRREVRGVLGPVAIGLGVVLLSATGSPAQFGGVPESVTRSLSGSRSDGSARSPSMSSDGRFTAFESEATDLVPGDTNNNTDVFVHDAVADVTTRVSLNWKGQEARGDSYCPQISADGRYVTFLSRAWNMYAGGANLGLQPARVYVHDRHDSSTVWISRPVEELVSSFGAQCPSISGDGGRIVFPATFRIVVDEPGWGQPSFETVFLWDRPTGRVGPIDGRWLEGRRWTHSVISADGRTVVFASDQPRGIVAMELATGLIDTISDQRIRTRFGVSADGRFVTFAEGSVSWRERYYGRHVFLHDRATGVTQQITEGRDFEACGREGSPFPCDTVGAGRPSITADGRFVIYGSRSANLVGGSTHHGGQIYLFDRLTERTRRISVSPDGLAGESCSYDPAISPDGSTVAYKSASPQFATGEEHRKAHQMIRSEWRCDEDGSCRKDSACPPTPQACAPADRSSFELRRRPPGGSTRDRVRWRWRGSPDGEAPAFPSPVEDARYHLCVYTGDDRAVDIDIAVPTSGWQEHESGFRLRSAGPLRIAVRLRSTEKGPLILARGSGPHLDLPYLPLLAPSGLTVQLHESESGACWGTHFPADAIERNHAGSLDQATETRGRFVARSM